MTNPYQQDPPQPYPPQPYGGYGYPPAPPQKKKRKKWPFVLGGFCLFIIVAFAGCAALLNSAAEELDKIAGDHPEDVQVTACERDPAIGWPKATVNVTNPTDKPASYAITVSFQSPDGATQHGEGIAAVVRLAPGQSTSQIAQGTTQIVDGTALNCVVSLANRTQAL